VNQIEQHFISIPEHEKIN